MHPTQLEILDSLRQNDAKQFAELLRDVAETSDNLTYHLKQLQKAGYIESPAKGEYKLAQKGIVYLNNNLELNHDLFPTVSCMIELHGPDGAILVMRKLKQPYLGQLHLLTFGVISSTSLQAQIQEFLDRYQIKSDEPKFKCVHRKRVQSSGNLYVFDKFFVVFQGNFSDFEQEVGDRQFLTMTQAELSESTLMLSATKEVLDLDRDSGFSEATYTDSA